MKQFFVTSAVCLLAGLGFSQSANPIYGDSRWKIAQSLPEAPGQPVPVRSIVNNELVAYIKPDTKFLAFGDDGEIVTLAAAGQLGYIPATGAADLNPIPPRPDLNPGWGPSLEQRADAAEARSRNPENLSLAPLKTPAPVMTPVNSLQPVGGMAFNNGVNPQPGAALATGGIQGINQMVNPEMNSQK